MNSTRNAYDYLAPVYDQLARAVFGRTIRESQVYNLDVLRNDSRVLVLGGGTGWLLEELLSLHSGLFVWYVDKSAGMIQMSKNRRKHWANVTFVQGTIDDLPSDLEFDTIICNFFLDQFSPSEIHSLSTKFSKILSPDGLLLISDFRQTRKPKHRILLSLMISFFRLIGAIKISRLADWLSVLTTNDFQIMRQRNFYGDFIISIVLRKTNNTAILV